MAPITDLNWNQFNAGLQEVVGTNTNLITLDAYGKPTTLNIAAVVEDFPEDAYGAVNGGVLKFMARLFDACRSAQTAVNTNQPTGERLNAFGSPTNQAPVGTFVPIVRPMTTRADLSSATKIVGPNA